MVFGAACWAVVGCGFEVWDGRVGGRRAGSRWYVCQPQYWIQCHMSCVWKSVLLHPVGPPHPRRGVPCVPGCRSRTVGRMPGWARRTGGRAKGPTAPGQHRTARRRRRPPRAVPLPQPSRRSHTPGRSPWREGTGRPARQCSEAAAATSDTSVRFFHGPRCQLWCRAISSGAIPQSEERAPTKLVIV